MSKTFKDHGCLLKLTRGMYTDGNMYICFTDAKTNECYIDVTVNTPYSAKNTIVLDNDFLNLKELSDVFINKYCDGPKIQDVECGFVRLPKYYVNILKLAADSDDMTLVTYGQEPINKSLEAKYKQKLKEINIKDIDEIAYMYNDILVMAHVSGEGNVDYTLYNGETFDEIDGGIIEIDYNKGITIGEIHEYLYPGTNSVWDDGMSSIKMYDCSSLETIREEKE